jgi:superfamily II DNA or RNA helicase
MATGTGKTRIFLEFIQNIKDIHKAHKFLIVAPKTNLLDQIKDVIHKNAPLLKVHRYDRVAKESCQDILITTYQSLEREHQNGIFDDIDVMILDEVHFALSERRVASIDFFKNRQRHIFMLGFTATDTFHMQSVKKSHLKSGKIDVRDVLGEKIFEYALGQGLVDGYLSPYQIIKIELHDQALLKDLKRTKKDFFSPDHLEILINKEPINAVFSRLIQNTVFGPNGLLHEQGVIFTVSKKHAIDVSKKLNASFGDHYSKAIHSDLSHRSCQELIDGHKRGQIQVLVNVDILAEGYDNNQISYIIDFRPTESDLRMLQVFGRLTRKNSMKPGHIKNYIQLIVPGSSQCLLEDILVLEGAKNIPVFVNLNPASHKKRKRLPVIDRNFDQIFGHAQSGEFSCAEYNFVGYNLFMPDQRIVVDQSSKPCLETPEQWSDEDSILWRSEMDQENFFPQIE